MSICFTVSDIELDDAGLMRALDSFWDSNPAVKAVKDAVESVMKPIEAAVEQVEVFINAISRQHHEHRSPTRGGWDAFQEYSRPPVEGTDVPPAPPAW